ncbi:MAG: ribonuclease Z [Syntrophorhabdus sp. PtaU1.Bin058]|nr:MAG: ribonuclease Z [Syntrophorhabdus sp. PtaU1.Bin058]
MEGFIKFFGTGGARFVVSKQLRATGGLWLHYRETNLYIDPGPGALVRVHAAKERPDLSGLDGIILTHKHLDHANDVNALIEAMTDGGFKKRGILFCPQDAIGEDAVVHQYVRRHLEMITILKEKGQYTVKDVAFSTPVRHRHPVETYGLVFHLNKTIGLIADTRFFDGLPDHYHADCLIINVLRTKPFGAHNTVEHLALDDAQKIILETRPQKAILTHFGINMLKEKPYLLAQKLQKATGVEVIAARDGMKWEF